MAALLVLAACSSTATQTTTVGSRSGPSEVFAATFGSGVNSRFVGRWTLSDRFARSCTLRFLNEAMAGSGSVGKAEPAGYCTRAFKDVAGWRVVGRSLVLFDGEGDRLARLARDGSEAYRGRFRGPTLSTDVVLRKGFV